MKVIDLLNKIANGEDVPKKVKILDKELLPEYRIITWNKDLGLYEYKDGDEFDRVLDKHHLNIEIEIIEDTPKECFRLMGVKDEDFEKVEKNQSNSSLYHLAGDSICTSCLMAIFGNMLGIDWKEKVKELYK